jgi:hypothetical protein
MLKPKYSQGYGDGQLKREFTNELGEKECSKCKQYLAVVKFTKNKRNISGLGNFCKKCNILHVKEWKEKQDPRQEKIRHGVVSAKWYEELKLKVINYYGGACYCCGEDRLAFLTLDHIDGGGLKHKKEINIVGSRFYKWLENNNYPKEIKLRSACMNCNFATRFNKICPHKMGDV